MLLEGMHQLWSKVSGCRHTASEARKSIGTRSSMEVSSPRIVALRQSTQLQSHAGPDMAESWPTGFADDEQAAFAPKQLKCVTLASRRQQSCSCIPWSRRSGSVAWQTIQLQAVCGGKGHALQESYPSRVEVCTQHQPPKDEEKYEHARSCRGKRCAADACTG